MAQRGTRRFTGSIEPKAGNALFYPMPAWISGRFYTSYGAFGALGAQVMNSSAYCTPLIVPNQVTVTSVGLEVTGAGTAGALTRFGIYASSPVSSLPSNLLVDCGTIATDGTGFLTTTISLAMQPGHYWIAAAHYSPTTYPTVRAHATGALFLAYCGATLNTPASGHHFNIIISSMGALWAVKGMPARMITSAVDSSDGATFQNIGTSKIARVMIGV